MNDQPAQATGRGEGGDSEPMQRLDMLMCNCWRAISEIQSKPMDTMTREMVTALEAQWREVDAFVKAGRIAESRASQPAASGPIPMILPCPKCGLLHVDAPEPEKGWTNPPHKSHLCHGCGAIWRPADVETTGVTEIATGGSKDTWKPIASGGGEGAEVEAVARAIFDVRSKDVIFFGNRTPETLFASRRMWYMEEARAAIAALSRSRGGGAPIDNDGCPMPRCPECSAYHELVRPGKTQPTCLCEAYRVEVMQHGKTRRRLERERERSEKAEQERDALRAELAGVRGGAGSGWAHAEDRNPASGGCYIAQDDDGEVLPAWWNGRRWEDSCGAMIFPLRWQPLPVPPKDKPPASAGDGRGA